MTNLYFPIAGFLIAILLLILFLANERLRLLWKAVQKRKKEVYR